jgi:4-hydroxy-3-polyprenylbenzoate decarboxylase
VIFAITTRCNPVEDMDVIRGIPGLMLDPRIAPEHRAVGDSTTSTMIINACRPWSMRNAYPRVNIVSKALRDEALAKWGDILKL